MTAMRDAGGRDVAPSDSGVLSGGGEMGAAMRAMDWSATPLGPVEQWSQALKTSVRIMLTSRQPMFVWWGDQLINLYNDAYRDILGGKHPWALGQPAEAVWEEIWDQVGPRARSAMQENEGTYDEALLLIMERHGYPEETYYTFSYSPVPNDAGGTGGILCANTNDTQRIIGERQITLLRTLAAETSDARAVEDACRRGGHALESNLYDLPFALIYLIDREQRRAVLAGRANVPAGHPAAPEILDLDSDAMWPVAEVLRTNAYRMSDLAPDLGPLPAGAWDRPPSRAITLPIAPSGETGRSGILIAGLSPYRLFDIDYQRFLELVSGQMATGIANAQAYEAERTRADALAELDRAKTAFFEADLPVTELTPAGGRLLLADDNADMREYLVRLLGRQYTVEAVADGEAALAAIKEQPPDLVVSDIMMPRLDGFGVLRALRDDPETRGVPIILLSARAKEEARIEGIDAGADDYLVKPFAARELLALVRTHLALARGRAEAARREQALRTEVEAERAHLYDLFMQAPVAIGILRGPEHVYEQVNGPYLDVVGRREILGKPIREALPELEGQAVYELFDHAYTTGELLSTDETVAVIDRGHGHLEEGYFNVAFQPFRDENGEVGGILVLAVEVTDQVRARQDLEVEVAERTRAERLLAGERTVLEMIARGRLLAETLDVLACCIEAEAPDALCSILLLDRDGLHLRHGAAPNLPADYNQAIDGIAIGPTVGSCGTAAYRGEPVIVADIAADPLWAEYRELAVSHDLRACWSTPIRGSSGQVLGTFALYHRQAAEPRPEDRELVDVLTYLAGIAIERHRGEEERRDLLEQEREARTAAEDAVRVRDEFLSIASHELRTPVTVVKGVTQMLQRSARRNRLDPDRLPRHIGVIERATDRLALLINDLLDVSRLQSGQLASRPERLDLIGLVRDAVDRHVEPPEGEHVLLADLPDSLVVVDVDAARLDQVFDNLLSNAVKYTPAGGTIEVTVELDADGVTVAIRDNGIGLPEGVEERIFEPFGRAANAMVRSLPGLGLGLHISRRIAELHGGRLWAESAGEGRGSTFRLWLPRVPEPFSVGR